MCFLGACAVDWGDSLDRKCYIKFSEHQNSSIFIWLNSAAVRPRSLNGLWYCRSVSSVQCPLRANWKSLYEKAIHSFILNHLQSALPVGGVRIVSMNAVAKTRMRLAGETLALALPVVTRAGSASPVTVVSIVIEISKSTEFFLWEPVRHLTKKNSILPMNINPHNQLSMKHYICVEQYTWLMTEEAQFTCNPHNWLSKRHVVYSNTHG